MSGWERIAGSLGLDASELDDLRPLLGFIGAERSEIREARFIIAGRRLIFYSSHAKAIELPPAVAFLPLVRPTSASFTRSISKAAGWAEWKSAS